MNDLKLFFFDPSREVLPWEPILRAKSTFSIHLVVRMTFARVAP